MSSDNHVRHCILFAFHLKNNVLEAEKICSVLGENTVFERTYKKWYKKFRTGNFDLSHQYRSEASKKVEDEKLNQLLQENPCQTQKKLVE